MKQNNREIWLSLIAIFFITVIYLLVSNYLKEIPAASGFFGHSLGILGFVLMILTETLYSFRKRSRSARWGKMSSWLQFHIFTGLVGPYLVLLHTSWKFNGLAGIVLLLTVIIVLSGIFGRYIYTSIPRTADGIEIEAAELERKIYGIEAEIRNWEQSYPEAQRAITSTLKGVAKDQKSISIQYWGRTIADWNGRYQWWQYQRQSNSQLKAQTRSLGKLLRQQGMLKRQIVTLSLARKTLSLWHTIHIPIGLALFTSAFIHILAAIYYATLLR